MKKIETNSSKVEQFIADQMCYRLAVLLVRYRDDGHKNYESFEAFCEAVLIGVYGAQQYKDLSDKIFKEVQKDKKNKK